LSNTLLLLISSYFLYKYLTNYFNESLLLNLFWLIAANILYWQLNGKFLKSIANLDINSCGLSSLISISISYPNLVNWYSFSFSINKLIINSSQSLFVVGITILITLLLIKISLCISFIHYYSTIILRNTFSILVQSDFKLNISYLLSFIIDT